MKNESKSSPFGLMFEVFAVVGLLIQIVVIGSAWGALPYEIPVHFDLTGNPDAAGSKTDLLLLLGLSLLSYIVLTVLGRFPEKFNYPWTVTEANAEHQYSLARISLK